MLLRRSGEQTDQAFHLEGVTKVDDQAIGVAHEEILLDIADAVYHGENAQLEDVRRRGIELIGPTALVDAIGVAAGFNGITKIANGTGIPLDDTTEQQTSELRKTTQIDEYAETAKSKRWDQARRDA